MALQSGHLMRASISQRYVSFIFISLALSLFIFLSYSALQLQRISIDLTTTQMGTIRILWASAGEPFSTSNSILKRIPRGQRLRVFIIRHSKRIHHLRVEPSFYHSYVTLRGVKLDSPKFSYDPISYPENRSQTTILTGIDSVKPHGSLTFRVADHNPALQINLESRDKKTEMTSGSFWLIAGFAMGCGAILVFLFHLLAISYRSIYRTLIFLFTVLTLYLILNSNGFQFFQPSVLLATITSLMMALVVVDLPFLIHEKLIGDRDNVNPGKLLFTALVVVAVFWMASISISLSMRIVSNYQNGYHLESAKGQPSGFTRYFKEQFIKGIPYKNDLLRLNALIKVFGFGYSPTSKVLLGEDNYFFEGYGERRVEDDVIKSYDNVSDYIGAIPFSENELEQWAKALLERKSWLEKKGIPYIFVLAPTKAQIYPEKLPKALRKAKDRLARPTRYDQLVRYLLENTDIPLVDLRSALLKAKEIRDYPPLFYRTDFHWNFYGAFHAYREITQKINQYYPKLRLESLRYDDFELKVNKAWAHPYFLRMVGLEPKNHKFDHYFSLMPKKSSPLNAVGLVPKKGVSDVRFKTSELANSNGETFTVKNIENPNGDLQNILVLGDSFIEKTLLFMSAHAKNTMHIRAVEQFPTAIYDFVKPDIVIQEILNMYILRNPIKNPPKLKLP